LGTDRDQCGASRGSKMGLEARRPNEKAPATEAAGAKFPNQPPLSLEHALGETARASGVSCLGFQAVLELLSRGKVLIDRGEKPFDELNLGRILDPPRPIDIRGGAR
jgi:hypothetical protein